MTYEEVIRLPRCSYLLMEYCKGRDLRDVLDAAIDSARVSFTKQHEENTSDNTSDSCATAPAIKTTKCSTELKAIIWDLLELNVCHASRSHRIQTEGYSC